MLSASPLFLPPIQSAGPELKPAAAEWTGGAIESAVSTIFWCAAKGAARCYLGMLAAFPEVGLGIRFYTLFLPPLNQWNLRYDAEYTSSSRKDNQNLSGACMPRMIYILGLLAQVGGKSNNRRLSKYLWNLVKVNFTITIG